MRETADIRKFGGREFVRVTGAMPLRRASATANRIRESQTSLARVDAYKGEYAVWQCRLATSDMSTTVRRGKVTIFRTEVESVGLKHVKSEVKSGRGVEVKRTNRQWIIISHPMNIPRHGRLTMQKAVNLTRTSVLVGLKRRNTEDPWWIVKFSQIFNVRKEWNSMKFTRIKATGAVVALPDDPLNGFSIRTHATILHLQSEGEWDDSTTDLTKAVADVKQMFKDIEAAMNFYNRQWDSAAHVDSLDDLTGEEITHPLDEVLWESDFREP